LLPKTPKPRGVNRLINNSKVLDNGLWSTSRI